MENKRKDSKQEKINCFILLFISSFINFLQLTQLDKPSELM